MSSHIRNHGPMRVSEIAGLQGLTILSHGQLLPITILSLSAFLSPTRYSNTKLCEGRVCVISLYMSVAPHTVAA